MLQLREVGIHNDFVLPIRQIDSEHLVGGTAGCIIAARLAAADPKLCILVIEAGKNNFADPAVTNPAVFLSHLSPESDTVNFYRGRKAKELAGREPIVPAGEVLGGVSLQARRTIICAKDAKGLLCKFYDVIYLTHIDRGLLIFFIGTAVLSAAISILGIPRAGH